VLFAFYRTDFKKEYCKQTLFKQDGDAVKVVRSFLADIPERKGDAILFDEEEIAYSGILHHYSLVDIINRDNWSIEQAGEWLLTWFNYLKKELSKKHGFTDADFLRSDLKIKNRYTDALPINLIIQENGYQFIDLEINLHKEVELGYIIFRAVYVSLSRLSSVALPRDSKYIETENILYALFSQLGFTLNPKQLERYYEWEANLVSNVTPMQVATMKGAMSRLRVRPVITEIGESHNRIQSLQLKLQSLEGQLQSMENQLESMSGELQFKTADITEKQNHIANLYHEIHSLSTSRKRMLKQFIKRTLPFLNHSV
jgi:hypothetical protein